MPAPAAARPLEIERSPVAAVRDDARMLDVTIADTIGQPVASSLGWCLAADCFVSIWGASVARYRWVCNRPGYVITSRANLLSRPDLHIYDSPRYVEDPSPMLFVAPEAVEDDPEAGLLLPIPGQPLYSNFRLDEEQVVQAIGRMLAETVAARRAVTMGSRRAPVPPVERTRRVREDAVSSGRWTTAWVPAGSAPSPAAVPSRRRSQAAAARLDSRQQTALPPLPHRSSRHVHAHAVQGGSSRGPGGDGP